MCHLVGVSRASYYRRLVAVVPDEAEMAMRVSIQEVVLAHHRRYGYRRVTMDLHRRGMIVNHKRVLRIMQEDNLLAIRYPKYILTTDSQHDCQVYLNLAARITVTSVNQLWVADTFAYVPYHLHPSAEGVRVPGGADRPVLAQRHRLGAGSKPHRPSGGGGATTSPLPGAAPARGSASPPARDPPWQRRKHRGSLSPPHHTQREPSSPTPLASAPW